MMKDNRIKELWGTKFNLVEEGLDEDQVTEFVDELIKERDTLLEQRDSLLSYVRLSKKIVGMESEQRKGSRQETGDVSHKVESEVAQDIQQESRASEIVAEVKQGIQPEIKTTELAQEAQSVLPSVVETAEVGEKPVLYQGEIGLEIQPPIDALELIEFERRLKDSFQLKILSIDGSPSKGCLIIVLLAEPQSLIQGLNQMDGVEKAEEQPAGSSRIKGNLFGNVKGKEGKRILLILDRSSIRKPID